MPAPPPLRSAREVSSTTPAPNSIEKIVRIFPSNTIWPISHHARLAPVAPPATVGSLKAAPGRPNAVMFKSRMPSSAQPRRTSTDEMRSRTGIGTTSAATAGATLSSCAIEPLRRGVIIIRNAGETSVEVPRVAGAWGGGGREQRERGLWGCSGAARGRPVGAGGPLSADGEQDLLTLEQ